MRRLIPLLFVLLVATGCTSADGDSIEAAPEGTTTTTSRAQRTTDEPSPTPTTQAESAPGTTPNSVVTPKFADLDPGDPGGDASGLSDHRSLGSVGDPTFPGLGNSGYDVGSYAVDLNLTGDEMVAETSIELTATTDLDLMHLDLVGLTVDEIRVDDEPALFNRDDRELIVRLPNPLRAGTSAEIFVAYHGTPAPIDAGDGLPFNLGFQTRDWGTFVASEPVGAATWFPANDHPQDKALFTISLTVPAGQSAVGPGRLVSSEKNTDLSTTFVWRAAEPMSTYLASVATGDFDVRFEELDTGVVIRHAVHRNSVAVTGDALDTTEAMIAGFEEQFGPYPFDTYGVLVVPETLSFALENQTLSLFGEDLVTNQSILAHELAHQWFGNNVSPAAWDDIWLNEGFATWAEWWWTERIGGQDFTEVAATVPMDPISGLSPTTLFDFNVYWRGGLTLEALRRQVGDETFGDIVREWSNRYGGGVASTEDFLDLVTEIAGTEASNVVSQWVFSQTMPQLPPDR